MDTIIGQSPNGESPDAAGAANLIVDGDQTTFMKDVIEASRTVPVLVDFWATWCGPCKTLTPTLEKIVRAAQGRVRLVKIDIDKNPRIAGQLGVAPGAELRQFSTAVQQRFGDDTVRAMLRSGGGSVEALSAPPQHRAAPAAVSRTVHTLKEGE